MQAIMTRAGITVNGTNAYDIRTRDPHLMKRLALGGSLALGETYVEGLWECDDLEGFIARMLHAMDWHRGFVDWPALLGKLQYWSFNLQAPWRAKQVCEQHYDLPLSLFEAMLDPSLTYTCAYFQDPLDSLADAQARKLELVCKKLELEPGHTLLDIGCGFGSFLRHAARHHGARGTGVTLSRSQLAYAEARADREQLAIDHQFLDYRRIAGRYDRIASIGMFEAVGPHNYRRFFEKVAECLEDDGIFVLHTVGSHRTVANGDPWVNRYIFPNGVLPSLAGIFKASEGLFRCDDVHTFGPDYRQTLQCWQRNFDAAWPQLSAELPPSFSRMWTFYLQVFAGAFKAGHIDLWQFVFTKPRRAKPRVVREVALPSGTEGVALVH